MLGNVTVRKTLFCRDLIDKIFNNTSATEMTSKIENIGKTQKDKNLIVDEKSSESYKQDGRLSPADFSQ